MLYEYGLINYAIIQDMLSCSTNYKVWAIFGLLLLTGSPAHAQFNDAGMLYGLSLYHGDLSSNGHAENLHSGFGIQVRRNFSPRIAGRVQLTRGVLQAQDKFSVSLSQRQRNLSFRSEFVELHCAAEWHFSRFEILDGKNSTPFATLGLGALYFNPQAAYQGVYYDLQPLGTEGQGLPGYDEKYTRITAQMPVGLGFKWAWSKRILFQAQVLHHFTLTDYLDDVSGNYADIEEIRNRNSKAAQLAYRTPELIPDQLVANPKGQKRGDDRKFDRFTNFQVGISFILSERYDLEWKQEYRIHDDPKPAEVKRRKKKKKRKETLEGVF